MASTVARAASGAEALAAVATHQPEICVFDVTMPDGDGISTLKHLRAHGDRRPVVLLTAQIDNSRLRRSARARRRCRTDAAADVGTPGSRG